MATNAGGPRFQARGPAAFGGHDPVMPGPAFDLLLADMDLDGDPDLLINWHHLGPLELYENREGTLVPVDRGDGSVSGLVARSGAPGLFAESALVQARASRHGEPGLYLWHEPDRKGAWRFLWKDESGRYGGLVLDLVTSLRVERVDGLADDEVVTVDDRRREIRLSGGAGRRRFGVKTAPIGVRLEIRLHGSPSGDTPPLFVGSMLARQPDSTVALWKPDPHGIAWVDVEQTPHPDLFITRGGLSGQLRPPLSPKTDRYFVHTAGSPFYRRADGVVPPGFGRGRSVEWVDVDNDGRAELSVANEASANRLLFRDAATGKLIDRAPALGLDLDGAAVQCWSDLDGDGLQDLLYLDASGLKALRNRAGERFEPVPGAALGLDLPPVPGRGPDALFERAALRLADFDADGDLDLWVLGRGPQRRNDLFLREGAGFRDAGADSDLDSIRGNEASLLVDVNHDGFEDLFGFGRNVRLWLNQGGRRLRPHPLKTKIREPIRAADAADIDGDGRVDLVLAGRRRHLLRNVGGEAGSSLVVELRDPRGAPVGALVTAVYSDGARVVRRLGSGGTTFSQSAEPLRFARRPGTELRSVLVRWPGTIQDSEVRIDPGLGRLVLDAQSR